MAIPTLTALDRRVTALERAMARQSQLIEAMQVLIDLRVQPNAAVVDVPISEIGLPMRIQNKLAENWGCLYLRDLQQLLAQDILRAPNCGEGMLREIQVKLRQYLKQRSKVETTGP